MLQVVAGPAAANAAPDSPSLKSKLKTVIVADYFPYTFVNKDGVPDGFSVDLAKEVTRVMGMDLEIRVDSWDRARGQLETGAIDLLPMMAYSEERDRLFDFSVPHTIAYDAFFTRNDERGLNAIEDIKGRTVIVMKGDQAHDFLRSSGLADPGRLILVDSLPEALRQLASGRGDAALMPHLVGLMVMRDLNLSNLSPNPVVVESYTRPFSFAVQEGNQALLERLNQGLNIVRETGQYRALYDKWFGALDPREVSLKSALKYIISLLLVLVATGSAFALWSLSLRKQVAWRTKKLEDEIIVRRQAETRFRQIAENIHEVFWLGSLDWKEIYYISPAYEQVWGKSCEDLYRSPLSWFASVVDEDREKVRAAIPESITPETREIAFPDYRIRRPDNGLVWIAARAFPVPDEEGRPYRIAGIAEDITERKLAEEEREKLQLQLAQAQKMESIGRLAGGVAHDFNNILSVIIGHTEMALARTDPSQPLYAGLQEVHKAARRSSNLTRQLLAFARKQTVAPQVLDLNETIEGMLKMLRRLIGEEIELAWLPGVKVWPIRMDPSQIDQILANLCVNARDAISGTGKVTIETRSVSLDKEACTDQPGCAPGDYALLAVTDNGCGMDQIALDNLFEPFFTTKELGKGTGLGLATVYGIVRQNSGFISVTSAPGRGTTFTICLPHHAAEPPAQHMDAPAVPVSRGRETILVTEDEPAILDMARIMLEDFGYRVLTASRPGEAVRIARKHDGEIHLLVTDVVMPEMNGKDLVKEVGFFYPGIKSLFMSGYTGDIIAHRGVLNEGVNFIEKPFSMQTLAARVRAVLDSPGSIGDAAQPSASPAGSKKQTGS